VRAFAGTQRPEQHFLGRNNTLEQQGFTVWFTGLSGAGKTTIADAIAPLLRERGITKLEKLDGDVVRTHLSRGLGFSKEDRDTNIRRIGWVAEVLTRNGVCVLASAISPYRDIRDEVRGSVGNFVEVFVRCSIPELTRRDVKGLYEKAIKGEIKNFTGVSDPYEHPLTPEVTVDSEAEELAESVAKVMAKLEELGYVPAAVKA
jgi:adenylyl-sulfate kinase